MFVFRSINRELDAFVFRSINLEFHLFVFRSINRELDAFVYRSINPKLHVFVFRSIDPEFHVFVFRSINPELHVFIFRSIALTKIDVLDELEEIKVAVAYKIDGVELPSFPGTCFFFRKIFGISHIVNRYFLVVYI